MEKQGVGPSELGVISRPHRTVVAIYTTMQCVIYFVVFFIPLSNKNIRVCEV